MEYVLNRLKSEFALARLLYYQALLQETDRWETYDDEVIFTELYEGESIGTRSEMTRTSFRMCFGILDKIGRAICDLFDLANPDEPIYFESFWRPRGKDLSSKQKERWPRLNSIRNFPLLALYSQATDLNSHSGEWGIFKAWRNALEHGMMMLSYSKEAPLDPYGVLKDNQYLQSVHYDDFVEKTLHFLRLTRSAIFNFTFCARHEGIKHRSGVDGTYITIRFDHKQS
jgi:hypothetical protein